MKILQILVLMICLAILANAQKNVLTGRVYDPNGAVIVKSKVTAVNQKGEKFEALTNDEGIYVMSLPYNEYNPTSNFRIAKYDITVESGLPGFEKFTLKDFKVVGKYAGAMHLDFALDVLVMEDPIPVLSEDRKPN